MEAITITLDETADLISLTGCNTTEKSNLLAKNGAMKIIASWLKFVNS